MMRKRMFPKQFRLTQQQNLLLKHLAQERGVSESEVVRQALVRYLEMEDIHIPTSGETVSHKPGVDKDVVLTASGFDSSL